MVGDLSPLGRYIKQSEEKNTNLIAKRLFGLSALDGLVELPIEFGKENKKSYWILREGQIAIDLVNFGSVGNLSFGRYKESELGFITSTHFVFSVTDNSLSSEYLFLVLKSQRTHNFLIHFACHGSKMTLPLEDLLNLPIRVPPPANKKS